MTIAPAALAPASALATPERIYLNRKLSDLFGLEYADNFNQKTIIHTNALDRAFDDWDDAHQAIIDRGGELSLRGVRNGWWEVIA